MTTKTENAISFKQVEYRTGDLQLLKQINGVFPKGKITTVIGPSGSGKTTLLKLCNGLLSPSAGTIRVFDKAIDSYLPTELRRLISIALQHAPMIHGSVFQNLALPAKIHQYEFSEKTAITLLEKVGLPSSYLQKNIQELSGGQKQRVSLARAFVNRSKIILLDEITSSLDQKSVHMIEQLIIHLNKKENITIIWITHDLQQAKKVGDFMWFLNDGQVIETGNIHLLTTSVNEQLQKFVQGVGK